MLEWIVCNCAVHLSKAEYLENDNIFRMKACKKGSLEGNAIPQNT